jgi:glycosyltransferase involved in cell wall biosynthesis
MRIAIASTGFPGPSGGSAITMLVLMQALSSLGHDVRFVKLDIRGQAPSVAGPFPFPTHRLAVDSFRTADPEATAALVRDLNEWKTDAVFFYGYETLAALEFGLLPPHIRKIILLGDPYPLVGLESIRNGWETLKERGATSPLEWRNFLSNSCSSLLENLRWRSTSRKIALFDWGYATAAHHAAYYRRFNNRVVYRPSPVLGPATVDVAAAIETRTESPVVTFLYVGHNLAGTSNTAGIRYLARLLQVLERVSVPGRSWRLLIAGGTGKMDDAVLARLKDGGRVETLGHVDLESTAPRVTVLLNTIPHRLGNRTRIASCFAYGIPTLSHVAAVSGMPSLADAGAVLFETDAEFLEGARSLIEDRALYRRLSTEAYASFQRLYSMEALRGFVAERLGTGDVAT